MFLKVESTLPGGTGPDPVGIGQTRTTERESIKRRPPKRGFMLIPLQEDVHAGFADASGWFVLLASLLVTVGWLWYLYR